MRGVYYLFDRKNVIQIRGKCMKRIKRILPIALCFLLLGNYSEGSCVLAEEENRAEAETSEDTEAEKKYERFLKNEEKVHIDISSIPGNASFLEKVDGKDCNLNELIRGISEKYNSIVNPDSLWDGEAFSGIRYAFISCGADKEKELVLRIEDLGIEDWIENIIFGISEGRLKIIFSDYTKGAREEKDITANGLMVTRYYGGDMLVEVINADGKLDYLYSVYDGDVFEELEVNNTPEDDSDDLYYFIEDEAVKRDSIQFPDLKDDRWDKYYRFYKSYYKWGDRYNGVKEIEDCDYFRCIEVKADVDGSIKRFIRENNIRIYTKKQVDKVVEALLNSVNITSEESTKEIKWKSLDRRCFHSEDAQPDTNVDYGLYRDYIESLNEVMENPEKFDENIYGISYEFPGLMKHGGTGYLEKDLDGDGIRELLLGYDNSYESELYAIFTIRGGRLYRVCYGWSRCRYYLCDNGMIANEGSSGYANSSWEYFNYREGRLDVAELVYTDLGNDYKGHCYYSDMPSFEYATNEISDDDMQEIIDKYKYVRLQLTPFECVE